MKKALFKNEKGSAIVWSVLVLAMLCIFVTAALTTAFAYHQRSLKGNLRRQAYLTSRSVAEAIADTVAGSKLLTSPFIPETAGETYDLSGVGGLPDSMGDATVKVTRNDAYNAVISATTVVGDMTYTYDVNLVVRCIDIPAFKNGLYVDNAMPANLNEIKGDLYINGSGSYTLDFPVSGNVYVPNGTLTIGINGRVSGRIYARTLAGYMNAYIPLLIASPNPIPSTVPSAVQCETVPASEWGGMFSNVYSESAHEPDLTGVANGGSIRELVPQGKTIDLAANTYYTYPADGPAIGDDISYKVTGSGTVYIIVEANATFDVPKEIENINRQSVTFILKDRATLNFTGPNQGDVKLSVYGNSTTTVNILAKGGNANQVVTVLGEIISGTITSQHKLELEPDTDADYPSPSSDLVKVRWEISRTALG